MPKRIRGLRRGAAGRRPVNFVAFEPVAPPNLHERSDYGSSSFFLSGDTGTIQPRCQRAVVLVAPVAPHPPIKAEDLAPKALQQAGFRYVAEESLPQLESSSSTHSQPRIWIGVAPLSNQRLTSVAP
jgi:hypothetical protein